MKFRDLQEGSFFVFSSERNPAFLTSGIEKGPWIKDRGRAYHHLWKPLYTLVGSINVEVFQLSPQELWEEFGYVTVDEDECIDVDWHIFPAGTHREEVWHWFEEWFDVSVASLMHLT